MLRGTFEQMHKANSSSPSRLTKQPLVTVQPTTLAMLMGGDYQPPPLAPNFDFSCRFAYH